MDLPTYTNIWRIEKRLYKLYDFRLPAPLPINWIAVFAGITVPYILLLVAIGLPFNHTLVWLYVLPPGLLTWLTTRPVIESKRLPELLESQVRYLTEPRSWCRMAPATEKDQVVLTARVWHSQRIPRQRAASVVTVLERGSLAKRKPAVPVRPARVPVAAAQHAAAQHAAAQGNGFPGTAFPVEAAPARVRGFAGAASAASGLAAGPAARGTAGPAAGESATSGTARRGLLRGRASGTAAPAPASAPKGTASKGSAGKRLAGPVVPAPPLPASGGLNPARLWSGQGKRLGAGLDSPTRLGSGQDSPTRLRSGQDSPTRLRSGQDSPTRLRSGQDSPTRLRSGQDSPAAAGALAFGSATAPVLATQPEHATPTVAPVRAGAGPEEQVRVRGVAASSPGIPSREAGPRIEVAHNRPAHRPVPPSEAARERAGQPEAAAERERLHQPADPARAWPSVGYSAAVSVPAAPATPAPAAPATPMTAAAPGESPVGEHHAPTSPAGPAPAATSFGRGGAARSELFSLLANISPGPSASVPPAPAETPASVVPPAPAVTPVAATATAPAAREVAESQLPR